MNPQHGKLAAYVNAASDLGESLKQDLKDGREISDDTIRYMSKFIKAAQDVEQMLELIEEISDKRQMN